jgi:hypothetical protein
MKMSASGPAGTPAGRRLLSLCLIAAACIAVDATGPQSADLGVQEITRLVSKRGT